MLALLLSLAMSAAQPLPPATAEIAIREWGAPSEVSESRGFLAMEDASGKKWLIGLLRDMASDQGSRVSLVMIDPENGATQQFFYSEPETVTWDSFCLFISSAKKVYTTIGGRFLEFDPIEKRFTFIDPKPIDGNLHAFSMAEDGEGKIYFASYPDARLEVFDPESREIRRLVQLDPSEKYPTTLAVDDDGWLYSGIGPANGLIIAYHIGTGELRQLVPKEEIRQESYPVILKEPGGKIFASYAPQAPYLKPFQRLRGGAVVPGEQAPDLSWSTAAYPLNSLYSFRKEASLVFSDGSRIEEVDPVARTFHYRDTKGVVQPKSFQYESRGAAISSLVAGSDGKLYGSTEHPMTFWQHDPATGKNSVLGRISVLGGGNMTHIVARGDELLTNTYSNGLLYRYDLTRPFADGENPRQVDRTEPIISRPRALLLHPDERHLLSAGYPGYGRAGGGLLIYDLDTDQRVALLEADDLAPGEAITAMTATPLPEGDLYFGTSIWTPGGGASQAKSATLGRFSWKERKLLWSETPIPGEETILGLHWRKGQLFGITYTGLLFAFDPESRKVIARRELKDWGEPVGRRGDTSFTTLPDGRLLLAMQEGLLEINPETLETTLLARSPLKLRDGGVWLAGRLYYAAFHQLLSFEIPQPSLQP